MDSTLALASSTRRRVAFLDGSFIESVREKEVDAAAAWAVLAKTFWLYRDRASQTAVLRALDTVITADPDNLSALLAWLNNYVQNTRASCRPIIDVKHVSFLLCACLHVFDHVAACAKTSEAELRALVSILAAMTESILYFHEEGIKSDFLLHKINRGIQSHTDLAVKLLSTIIASPAAESVALLGKLLDSVPADRVTQDIQLRIIKIYKDIVIGSKTLLPRYTANALHPFLLANMEQAAFEQEIKPTLTRMLLRSPEIMLAIAQNLGNALSFDSSPLVLELQSTLVTQFQSTNSNVRHLASLMLQSLLCKALSPAGSIAILNAYVTGSKKISSAEYRGVFLQSLASTPLPIGELAPTILSTIAELASKETNEACVRPLCLILAGVFKATLLCSPEHKATSTAIVTIASKLSSKPNALTRYWIECVAVALVDSDDVTNASSVTKVPQLNAITQPLVVALRAIFESIMSAPLTYSGSAVDTYQIIAVLLVLGEISAADPSFEQLFQVATNDRIFKKLTTRSEMLRFTNVLQGLYAIQPIMEKNLANAIVFMATVSNDHIVKRRAQQCAAACLLAASSSLGQDIVLELTHMIESSVETLPTFSRDAYQLLNAVARSDCRALTSMASLAHHPLIASGTQSWVQLAFMAKYDFTTTFAAADSLLMQVSTLLSSKDASWRQAAVSLAATLVVIDHRFVSAMSEEVLLRINEAALVKIDDAAVRIWKTPEGVLCEDVPTMASSTNWDADLMEAARKKAGKRSPAEREQLAKEASIRVHMTAVKFNLVTGLELIKAIHSTPGSIDLAIVQKHLALLLRIIPKAYLLVGHAAEDVVPVFFSCIPERLKLMHLPLVYALLRLKDIPVRESWCSEPLAGLIIRVLYRLRFAAEVEAFEADFFAVLAAFLDQVIRRNGEGLEIENAQYDEEGNDADTTTSEQTVLAFETLCFHAGLGSSKSFPRSDTLRLVFEVISNHPRLSSKAHAFLASFADACGDLLTVDEYRFVLATTKSPSVDTRQAALIFIAALPQIPMIYPGNEIIFVLRFDENADTRSLALDVEAEHELDTPAWDLILPHISSAHGHIRQAAARSIASLFASDLAEISIMADVIRCGAAYYTSQIISLEAEYDKFGMLIPGTDKKVDPWQSRVDVALLFEGLSPFIGVNDLDTLLSFFFILPALGDKDSRVRMAMLKAASMLVDALGTSGTTPVLEFIDQQLAKSGVVDAVRVASVILYGRAARFLQKSDRRVGEVVDKLISILDTPSEVVQAAVADCLYPLLANVDVASYLRRFTDVVLNSSTKYAERQGAAYGLAAVVKGRGITLLSTSGLFSNLVDLLEGKKDTGARQGALFAFQHMSELLGTLFEPYSIQILTCLVICLGDGKVEIREAANDCSQEVMRHVSGHGVRVMLPILLKALAERNWRAKQGALELIGAMANCEPKHLSSCLPIVVPRLAEALTDSHQNVRASATHALESFGQTVASPEMRSLIPVIMNALRDPHMQTDSALRRLLSTAFVHIIDAPSLALIVPLVTRGLKERRSDIKRKSAQIVGSMSALALREDLSLYDFIPTLKEALFDSVPETRSAAARALGGLVRKLGEEHYSNLIPDLVTILRSDCGSADRQGAAQGISEILATLPDSRLDMFLQEVGSSAFSSTPQAREGYISLIIYMPLTYGPRFEPFIKRIIGPLWEGLAEESEYVREAALRAGQIIVNNFPQSTVELLLPELEKGLFNENWRIRLSSIQLLGDLLYKITGTESQTEEEDEDGIADADRRAKLVHVLGKDRTHALLAGLYIARLDEVGAIRQHANQIWKVLVQNTPRTLKEILSHIISLVRERLGVDEAQGSFGDRVLVDVVRKLGERIVRIIIPMLSEGLHSNVESIRLGATRSLSSILNAASGLDLSESVEDIARLSLEAICDDSPSIQSAGVAIFDALYAHCGAQAVEAVIPPLFKLLEGSRSFIAMAAMKEIAVVRPAVVFPFVVAYLGTHGVSASGVTLLSSIVPLSEVQLRRNFEPILQYIISAFTTPGANDGDCAKQAAEAVLDTVVDTDAMLYYLERMSAVANKRSLLGACEFAAAMRKGSMTWCKAFEEYVRALYRIVTDPDVEVGTAVWKALSALTAAIRKEDRDVLVVVTRQGLQSALRKGSPVPAFCQQKGIASFLPPFVDALMNGSMGVKETAAEGIGFLIRTTTTAHLKPFLAQVVGPLIRVAGEKLHSDVRASILLALNVLSEHSLALLKPFVPQLQRTYMKGLSDSSPRVRDAACRNLTLLVPLQPRLDTIVSELVTTATTTEEEKIDSYIMAIEGVIAGGSGSIGEAALDQVARLLIGLMARSNGNSPAFSKCMARYCSASDETKCVQMIRNIPSTDMRLAVLRELLRINITRAEAIHSAIGLIDLVVNGLGSKDDPEVATNALDCFSSLLLSPDIAANAMEHCQLAWNWLMPEVPSEIRCASLCVIERAAAAPGDLLDAEVVRIMPVLLDCARDRNPSVRTSTDAALTAFLALSKGTEKYERILQKLPASVSKLLADHYKRSLAAGVENGKR